MRNGEVKHSNDLVDKDLDPVRKYSEQMKEHGINIPPPTLELLKANPGYYVSCKLIGLGFGTIKGPFADPHTAVAAHREWKIESKHS